MDVLEIKELTPLRKKIDALDDQIIDLLGQRLGIIHEVSVIKAQQDIAPVLEDRVIQVRERAVQRAVALGYDADFIRGLYQDLIDYSCHVEQSYKDKNNKALHIQKDQA